MDRVHIRDLPPCIRQPLDPAPCVCPRLACVYGKATALLLTLHDVRSDIRLGEPWRRGHGPRGQTTKAPVISTRTDGDSHPPLPLLAGCRAVALPHSPRRAQRVEFGCLTPEVKATGEKRSERTDKRRREETREETIDQRDRRHETRDTETPRHRDTRPESHGTPDTAICWTNAICIFAWYGQGRATMVHASRLHRGPPTRPISTGDQGGFSPPARHSRPLGVSPLCPSVPK